MKIYKVLFWKQSWVLYSYLIKSRFSIPKTIYLNYFLEIFFFYKTHKSSIVHTISHSLVSQIMYTDEAILWFLIMRTERLAYQWTIDCEMKVVHSKLHKLNKWICISIREVYWDMIKCYHCFIHRLYIIKRSYESMKMKAGIQK